MPVAKVSPAIAGLWALLRLIVAAIVAVIVLAISIFTFESLAVDGAREVLIGGAGYAPIAVGIALAGLLIAVAIVMAPAIAALKAE